VAADLATDASTAMKTSAPADATAIPLTRREIRERERAAQERAAAGPAATAASPTASAEELPGSIDLAEREIAAPAAADAPVADIEQLLTDVPAITTSTPVQLPTRARMRSQLRGSSDTDSATLRPAGQPRRDGAARATLSVDEESSPVQPTPAEQAAAVAELVSTASVASTPAPLTVAEAEAVAAAAEPAPAQPPAAQPDVAPPLAAQADVAPRSSARRAGRAPFVPRSSVARTTVKPSPARGAGSRVRRGAAKGVTFAAMAFVALMAVSTSLPAEALLSSADVQAAAVAARQSGPAAPAQTLDMATGTDTISVQRDGYESKSIAEVAAASGIRLEATFTNNPNGTIQWPFAVGVHIGDHFGYRNCAGCSVDHGGQDFNPGIGAPIQAIADGVVSLVEDGEGSLGVHMMIDHMIDGKKVTSVYAHMIHGSMLFKTGDVVKVGQVIGKTGTTGMSTGPHLHFEIRLGGKDGTKVDPLNWLYANVN
jgi:murein DD-endopeptidase MepM/ murein hydrolase activator NlpD